MKTILLINIIIFLAACGSSDSPPPDKNPTHINQQIIIETDKPKPFYDIPEALNHIDSVKILVLIGQKFDKFPSDIFKLINLERLDLTQCNLDSIPELISSLKNLKDLSLRNNHIRILPNGLFTLTKLEKFDNFGNEITNLSPDIRNLKNLKELIISFNNLNTLPDLTGLTNLHDLSCDGNFLTSIPSSVCTLNKLQRLSLMRNKISKIDGCISQLKFLNNFVLSENVLSKGEIENVKKLLPNCGVYADMQK